MNADGHLWSQAYDREMDDIFAIQSEIARRVAEALEVKLLANEKRATESTEAYLFYLKGRYHWTQRTNEGVNRAMKYFEDAIRIDQEYALAYSGLADCYTISADWYWMDPNAAFLKAKVCDHRALEIDPELAEAHASLGIIYNSYDGRWSESENEFKQAIGLKPGLAYAHMWYGLLLWVLGRQDDALERFRVAANLDPLSRIVQSNLGSLLTAMGKTQEAIELFKQILEEYPDFGPLHEGLGWACFSDSRPEEAVNEIRQGLALMNEPSMKSGLACVLALTGERDEASKLLDELKEASRTVIVSKVQLAQILFALGKNDDAFAYLERASEDRSIFTNHASELGAIRFLPWFGGARNDRRWTSFETRLGF